MSTWTSQEDAQLMALLTQGHSFQEIANTMVKSRAAIAGRAFRLKHKMRPEVRNTTRRRKTKQVLKVELPPEEFTLTLMELTPQSCRWPSAEKVNGQTTFCGLRVKEGKSYCAHHVRKAKRDY